MTSLTEILSTTLKIYNNSITVVKSSENSINVLIEEELLFTIKDIDFDELNSEISLLVEEYKKSSCLVDTDKFYVPFFSNTIWSQEEIKVIDSNSETPVGKLITTIEEEHVGKYIFWMSKFDVISENIKNVIRNLSYGNAEFTLSELITNDLVIFEMMNLNLENPNFDILQQIESLIHKVRAKTAYNDVLLSEPVNIEMHNTLNKEFKNNSIIIDAHNTKNIDAYSYFISAKNEANIRMKYLDYYHVIEYYFYSSHIKIMKELIEKVIYKEKMESFDGADERLKLIKELFDELQEDKDYTKELNLFEELLVDFVTYDDLYCEIEDIDISFLSKSCSDINKTAIDIAGVVLKTKNSKVKNLEIPKTVPLDVKENFLRKIAGRLYSIRNFIVHSTKYKGKHSFVSSPRLNVTLEKDIELIEKIAYILLNKNIEL